MLDPTRTLTIILGVSECKSAPSLQPLPQCANSAAAFDRYLRTTLSIPNANIKNLFDSAESASDQLEEIEIWLTQRMQDATLALPTDLFVYYTGHGGFSRNDQSYFLAVRKTRAGSEGGTSLRYVDLSNSIKRLAETCRKFFILDCCFAAAAVVRIQSDITQMVSARVADELPTAGMAVLCSSAAKLVSVAPPGEDYTMFSGALLECLQGGVSTGPKTFTLEDLSKATRNVIRTKFPTDAVRPELHVPEQSVGDPARVPLFPNPQWVEGTVVAAITDEDEEPQDWTVAALNSTSGRIVVGALSALLGITLCILLPHPFGLAGRRYIELQYAPLAPALVLSVTILLVLNASARVRLKPALAITFACIIAWLLAWMVAFHITWALAAQHKDWVNPALISSSGLGGLVGAVIPATTLFVCLWGRKPNLREVSSLLMRAVPFALWGAIVPAIFFLLGDETMGTAYLLALVVPWQSLFVTMMIDARDPRQAAPHPKMIYPLWIVASLLFALSLQLKAIYKPLDALLVSPSGPEIELAILSSTLSKDPAILTIAYHVTKNLAVPLRCRLEVRADNRFLQPLKAGSNELALAEVTANSESQYDATSLGKQIEARAECAGPIVAYTTVWQKLDLYEE